MAVASISILGCGWLGLPLGRHLVDEGYHVKGSTTTGGKVDTLRRAGIEPYRIELNPDWTGEDVEEFLDADLLFFNVPPPRRRDDLRTYHLRQIDAVRDAVAASPIDWIIFASSTSVYPRVDRVVTEDDVPFDSEAVEGSRRTSGEVLQEAEQRLHDAASFDTTVIRFAGLYGGDRHPGRFLAGRTNVSGGDAPVNLIHRDDCIGIVTAIIEQEARGEVFNACADRHPTRRTMYTAAAEAMGLEPPTFEPGGTNKVVSNEKVKRELGYTFKHPDPSVSRGEAERGS